MLHKTTKEESNMKLLNRAFAVGVVTVCSLFAATAANASTLNQDKAQILWDTKNVAYEILLVGNGDGYEPPWPTKGNGDGYEPPWPVKGNGDGYEPPWPVKGNGDGYEPPWPVKGNGDGYEPPWPELQRA